MQVCEGWGQLRLQLVKIIANGISLVKSLNTGRNALCVYEVCSILNLIRGLKRCAYCIKLLNAMTALSLAGSRTRYLAILAMTNKEFEQWIEFTVRTGLCSPVSLHSKTVW